MVLAMPAGPRRPLRLATACWWRSASRRWRWAARSQPRPTALRLLAAGRLRQRRGLRAVLALFHQDGGRLVRRPRARDGDGDRGDELAVRHRHGPGRPRLARRDAKAGARRSSSPRSTASPARSPCWSLYRPAADGAAAPRPPSARLTGTRMDTDPDRRRSSGRRFNAAYVVYLSFAPRVLIARRPGRLRGRFDRQPGELGDDLLGHAVRPRSPTAPAAPISSSTVCLCCAMASLALLPQVAWAVPVSLAFGLLGVAPAGLIMALTGCGDGAAEARLRHGRVPAASSSC